MVGTGGRTAMAGPVFYRADFSGSPRAFPQWYDGKLFIYEWMRGWVMAVTMDSAGNFVSMERFMPGTKFANPQEMAFGPSGDLFMLEYGTGWFQGNDDARLVRIEYNAGNRAPSVVASVDRGAGALPLRVQLSSAGTTDADDDSLMFSWTIRRANGDVVRRLAGASPTLTLSAPGTYTATLNVRDAQGASAEAETRIIAGNQPPTVSLALGARTNRTFFFPGATVHYGARVMDREDGSLDRGIPAGRVRVTAEFLREAPAPNENGAGAASPHSEAIRLIEASNCLACHQFDRTSIGPSYRRVAEKYTGDTTATERLVNKILRGGRGVWGEVSMPAHPALSEREATLMVSYIRSIVEPDTDTPPLPVAGSYVPADSLARAPTGVIALRAAYTDRGAPGLPGLSADTTIVLRSPTVVLASGEVSEGTSKMKVEQLPVEITIVSRPGASVRLRNVDLTGITAVTLTLTAPAQFGARGGFIEVRADSATGMVLGGTSLIPPQTQQGAPPIQERVSLTPIGGMHDLYFVVKNDAVTGDGMLMVLVTATFEAR
jgi:cytochrome c